MKIQPLLICLIVVIALECSREYSCEGCRDNPTDTTRTIPNELIANCSFYIEDEVLVKKVYVEESCKYHPATYHIIDSIPLTRGTQFYEKTFDLKNYLNLNDYIIGDTIWFRNEIRWTYKPATFVCDTVLIY